MSDRGFITPPPGLLPEPPAPREPGTGTGASAPSKTPPLFFPAPGPPPAGRESTEQVGQPPPSNPEAEPADDPAAAAAASFGDPAEPASPPTSAGALPPTVSIDGREVVLTGELYLGRSPVHPGGSGAAILAIPAESTVSKTHAVLRLTPGGVELEDLGSTNGTAEMIGGEPRLLPPRSPRPLRLPATIRLGDAVATIATPPTPA